MIAASNETCVQLVARDASGSSRSYELGSDQGVFVGQSSNCGLQVRGEGIGDIHCRIGFEDGRLQVQDWMSATGTRVNGAAIDSPTELVTGDVIEIGSQQITVGAAAIPSGDSQTSSQESKLGTGELAPETVEPHSDHPDGVFEQNSDVLDDPSAAIESIDSISHDAPESMDEPIDFAPVDAPAPEGGMLGSDAMDFDADFSAWEEEETFDRETVELLKAEIEDLQAALAQRDSEQFNDAESGFASPIPTNSESEDVERRLQELIDEANRSDERVALLEEMLHAAEDSNRNEIEERNQLESWLTDIEARLTEREEEHAAELNALKQRLETAQQEQDQLQRKLSLAASYGGNAPQQYEETLEKLQQANRQLQQQLDERQKQQSVLEKQLEEAESQQDSALREERASIAKEQARLSRMRFEISQKVADVEMLPKEGNEEQKEMSHKFLALREHLREIHEQEKKEEAEASLTSRLAKLWKRVEY